MKKEFLIRNPELFQGEKYLNKNKNYFEGWYFKNSNENNSISFIPGIHINKENRNAFIQVITVDNSYYVNYDINDFEYSFNPFYIRIKDNYFSLDNIHIDIKDNKQNLTICGDVGYTDTVSINKSIFNPNIMGPFSYLSFLECNHAVLCMKCKTNGIITINNKIINLENGISYIEKDYGYSFPSSYIWCQGNNFKNTNASFMLSIADIPFKLFRFKGLICSLIIHDKEYRFATYNNSKIIKYNINKDSINIILKRKDYLLYISSKLIDGFELLAPIKGSMKKKIIESISSKIDVTLKKNDVVIFSDTSNNCGLEIAL